LNYDWNFFRLKPYASAFLGGTATTIEITVLVIIFGTILGVLGGLLMKNRIARKLLYPIIDIVRAIPPLVLLLFFYYFLTQDVIGVTVDSFLVCVVALSVNLAAFTSDLVRAAVENTPRGALDGALALGMSDRHIKLHVVLPHVLREVVPGMTVLYIGMLKATSLASVISVREVVFTAEAVITKVARSLETWVVVALIYITLVIPATYGARRLERWAKHGNLSVPHS